MRPFPAGSGTAAFFAGILLPFLWAWSTTPVLAAHELIDGSSAQIHTSVQAEVIRSGPGDSLVLRVRVVNRSSRLIRLPDIGPACTFEIDDPEGQPVRVIGPHFGDPFTSFTRRALPPDSTLVERIVLELSTEAADSVLAAEAPWRAWKAEHPRSAAIPPPFIPKVAVPENVSAKPIVFWPQESGRIVPGMYTVRAGLTGYDEAAFGSTVFTIR